MGDSKLVLNLDDHFNLIKWEKLFFFIYYSQMGSGHYRSVRFLIGVPVLNEWNIYEYDAH